ncbi:SpoIIE family protein phosphatase [Streptomyces roseoverticillatus]|uniref:PP2C family protein-serine/threonine phosphatase n=1 Tax=Streptomyces roseoverticillatus TaxID=66429 RepID=UPI001F24E33B|nr:SpoIIE family protein phosphatase [Streptomyces roseoverticillatus]MCF3101361.1 SpoIIE family protein phosphatase [Streptomyces roseoverticillatus]
MPSPLHADSSAAQPPEHGTVDALISQTRRLRGGLDAVRRAAAAEEEPDDAHRRWHRALCDLAAHHLDDLGEHLGQLREGPPPAGGAALACAVQAPPAPQPGTAPGRVGSAEWNLLTDEATWSDELFQLFGRRPEDGPLTLDELPSWLPEEDRGPLTTMVTGCLVDGKPIDGEFRIVRADGSTRVVHMMGEPVLDGDGTATSMWAVLRDISELRRSRRAVDETSDSLQRRQHIARTEHRIAVELQEAVLPPWRGSLRFPQGGAPQSDGAHGTLDLAAHYLPSASSALIGGDWFDALGLPGGRTLLSVGGLTGHGVAATSGMAMLLGALRGMAVTGAEPGPLMGWLNRLLDASAQPALGSAVCCRYDPASRTLAWSQAGHPAPLLFRGGRGRALQPPEGMLLGAVADAAYGQAEELLEPGDVLLLHTDGLSPYSTGPVAGTVTDRLLDLAPRFTAARCAQECVRAVLEEFGGKEREDDACLLIGRING